MLWYTQIATSSPPSRTTPHFGRRSFLIPQVHMLNHYPSLTLMQVLIIRCCMIPGGIDAYGKETFLLTGVTRRFTQPGAPYQPNDLFLSLNAGANVKKVAKAVDSWEHQTQVPEATPAILSFLLYTALPCVVHDRSLSLVSCP